MSQQMESTQLLHYTVDGEPQETTHTRMTAAAILQHAGLDPNETYLVQIIGANRESYRGRPEHLILMREDQVFVTVRIGPVPVS